MNICDYLINSAVKSPQKTAFIFLENGEDVERKISYSDLYNRVSQVAWFFKKNQWIGKRIILLHDKSSEFIVSFFACMLSGNIAVPVHFSRNTKQISKAHSVFENVQSDIIVTSSEIKSYLETKGKSEFNEKLIVVPKDLDNCAGIKWTTKTKAENEIAFIQYTSGSTSNPKGVVISMNNLISNQISIKETFGCSNDSIIFSWLPFYHDMGLIGNIIHSVYIGCTAILMSPYYFLQKPARWLNAIGKYKVTHSGGPNFAFEYCINKISAEDLSQLNLSSWKVAYCGSEPIQKKTLDSFFKKFQKAGFKMEVFHPCYGLAEATLLVSGKKLKKTPSTLYVEPQINLDNSVYLSTKKNTKSIPILGCGGVPNEIKIGILSNSEFCKELEVGEICISGPNVSSGYWNQEKPDVFLTIDEEIYLRTGDLGFIHEKELFVHGRIKELLIIRGKNYYPNDVENLVSNHNQVILRGGVAVFGIDSNEGQIVILIELKRSLIKNVDKTNLIWSINNLVFGFLGVEPLDILFVHPFQIPRTSSGKLRRLESRVRYVENDFKSLASKRKLSSGKIQPKLQENLVLKVKNTRDYVSVKKYLTNIIKDKVGENLDFKDDNIELADIGIDSLRSMEIVNTINKDLGLNMDAIKLANSQTLYELINTLTNMLWLKTGKPSEKNIKI